MHACLQVTGESVREVVREVAWQSLSLLVSSLFSVAWSRHHLCHQDLFRQHLLTSDLACLQRLTMGMFASDG